MVQEPSQKSQRAYYLQHKEKNFCSSKAEVALELSQLKISLSINLRQ